MIKKILWFTVLTFFLYIPTGAIFAQTNTPAVDLQKNITERNEFQVLEGVKNTADSQLVSPTLVPAAISETAGKSIENILTGINDYYDRITQINKKIGTRIEKLKKAKVKTAQLQTKYYNLNRQLQLLKTQITKTQKASNNFLASRNPQKDYAGFKKQLTSAQNALKLALAGEKEIISQMAEYGSVSATPTAVMTQ